MQCNKNQPKEKSVDLVERNVQVEEKNIAAVHTGGMEQKYEGYKKRSVDVKSTVMAAKKKTWK